VKDSKEEELAGCCSNAKAKQMENDKKGEVRR